MNTMAMIKSLRYATLFGAVALLAVSCSKEQASPVAATNEAQAGMGEAKLATSFISFNGGSSPWIFNVYASNGCWVGRLYKNAGTNIPIPWSVPETTGDYSVLGETVVCNGVTDPAQYTFLKGPNATTAGPVYYIHPNQGPGTGRKILKLQFKGTAINMSNGSFFTYNPSTNTWNDANATTAKFTWSYVTSMPTCPGEC